MGLYMGLAEATDIFASTGQTGTPAQPLGTVANAFPGAEKGERDRGGFE